MQTHMEVDMRETVACQTAGPIDLRGQLNLDLLEPNLPCPKSFDERLVEEVALAVYERGDLQRVENRPTDDRIQVTADREIRVSPHELAQARRVRKIHVCRDASNGSEVNTLLDRPGNAFGESVAVRINDQAAHGVPSTRDR